MGECELRTEACQGSSVVVIEIGSLAPGKNATNPVAVCPACYRALTVGATPKGSGLPLWHLKR